MKTLQSSRSLWLALAATGFALALYGTASAGTYDITVDYVETDNGEFTREAIGFNGTSPGPVLRFTEGEEVTINVTNNLDESTSIHWHGLILPFEMDGVPTISFDGIEPGETFTYRFPIIQSGTYWYHSHSGLQEPDGAYGALIIEDTEREPFRYDREYVIVLNDQHPHEADRILRNLKMMPDYYNREQRTLMDFFDDVAEEGFDATLAERAAWGEMRMMPTDIEDVQGFTALMNGYGPDQNWTALFEPDERIRLRFINASAMAFYDIRIPGLEMTVVQADGNNVQPVKVDEFRIAVAETYDVIVRPREDRAYTIFAESMGRTAYARGTLATAQGMEADVPELRDPSLLTMADMGMAHGDMEGMDHGMMMDGNAMAGMDHSGMSDEEIAMMDHSAMDGMEGMDHSMMGGMGGSDPFYAPGSGLTPEAAVEGGRFLSYADLKAQAPLYEDREATREIEIRLTGNMERYVWSIDDVTHADSEPIVLQYGERVRFTFINETMMAHPMHLHGMWSILDVGEDAWNPAKHVISVAPGTTVSMETEVDAPGEWAFHCHLAYHAASGMFRKIVVEGYPENADVVDGALPVEDAG